MPRLSCLQERIDMYVVDHGREPTAALIIEWINELSAATSPLSSQNVGGALPNRAAHASPTTPGR